jgi:L-alanine-DL-glutamate epimerase-like enolase superfamily enzyme
MDLLQAPHTLLRCRDGALGYSRQDAKFRAGLAPARLREKSHRKTPYASVLFGDTAQETLERARDARSQQLPRRQVRLGADRPRQRREPMRSTLSPLAKGWGKDGILLVDTGQIFIEDVARAAARLPAMEKANVLWFEEPFHASALEAYGALARRSPKVRLAGGEGAHNESMARQLIDYGGIGYVQIDCGRIGGIGPSKAVADYAVAKGVTFVNHTFTSHLALSASLQPYAGLAGHEICEYPAMPKPLATAISANHLERDANGQVAAPDAPGLGIEIATMALRGYLQEVEISVGGKRLYSTPSL